MTEAPKQLLSSFLNRGVKTTDERLRLFGIACCLRVAEVLLPADNDALDCLEVYATSKAHEELDKGRRFHRSAATEASDALARVDRTQRDAWLRASARALASAAVGRCTKTKASQAAYAYTEAAAAMGAIKLINATSPSYYFNDSLQPDQRELQVQAALLEDIFGDPSRPVAFDPSWRTDTAVALARQMYESRDFGAMPILADALQDAGCNSEEVLAHCRDAGQPHVRGCWVVDLVLGKS